MKKIRLFLLISLPLLFSCAEQRYLSGTWIAAYQVHSPEDDSLMSDLRSIMRFEKDQMTIKSLDTEHLFDEFTLNYHLSVDNLVIQTDKRRYDTLRIISISDDSLVLLIFNEYERHVVFRRLDEASSPQLTIADLMKSGFTVSGPGYTDTVEFITDFQLFIGSAHYPFDYWTIKRFGDYRFLIIGEYITPFLVKSVTPDQIETIQIGQSRHSVTFKKLPGNENSSLLLGSWSERWRQGPEPVPFQIPKINLVINKDSLQKIEGTHSTSFPWKLGVTGTWIHFIGEYNVAHPPPWKIIGLTHEKLIIERQVPGFEGVERIEFERK